MSHRANVCVCVRVCFPSSLVIGGEGTAFLRSWGKRKEVLSSNHHRHTLCQVVLLQAVGLGIACDSCAGTHPPCEARLLFLNSHHMQRPQIMGCTTMTNIIAAENILLVWVAVGFFEYLKYNCLLWYTSPTVRVPQDHPSLWSSPINRMLTRESRPARSFLLCRFPCSDWSFQLHLVFLLSVGDNSKRCQHFFNTNDHKIRLNVLFPSDKINVYFWTIITHGWHLHGGTYGSS